MPYTYLIGWSTLDRWYYGVRFAKNCKPEDLWTTYFTSSKHVAAFRALHGEPDVVEVRNHFATANEARLFETRLLKRVGAVNSERWINKSNNRAIDIHDPAVRANLLLAIKNRPPEVEALRLSRMAASRAKQTPERRRQIAEASSARALANIDSIRKGSAASWSNRTPAERAEWAAKISSASKCRTDEERARISASYKAGHAATCEETKKLRRERQAAAIKAMWANMSAEERTARNKRRVQ